MKKQSILLVFITITCCNFCIQASCQQQEDSILTARNEQWKVKQNRGMFGLGKPQFGPYTTLNVGKEDKPVMRKKTKDSSDFDADISGEGIGLNGSKFLTIAKTKSYTMQLSSQSDTAKVAFAISSISKEKKQTLLGKMFSKNEEEESEVLSYNRDVAGTITTSADEKQWTFFIDNYTSGSRQTAANYYPHAAISGAYLKSGNDSLAVQTYSSFGADMIITNSKGEHLAALKFKQKPTSVWIRNDIARTYQQSIAAFFAVIIGIRDL